MTEKIKERGIENTEKATRDAIKIKTLSDSQLRSPLRSEIIDRAENLFEKTLARSLQK